MVEELAPIQEAETFKLDEELEGKQAISMPMSFPIGVD